MRRGALALPLARPCLAPLLALSLLGLAPGAAAQTEQTYVSNLGQADSGERVFQTYKWAQAFTTGSHSYGYSLRSVEVEFAQTASTFDVFPTIRNDNGGVPGGTIIGTLTNPDFADSSSDTTLEFTTTGINLEASTTYFILLLVTEPQIDTRIRTTTSDNEDTGATAGWSIGDTLNPVSIDGDRENPEASSMKIRIKGVNRLPTITVAPKSNSAVTEGDDAVFTVSASPPPTANLDVSLRVDDAPNSDFVAAGDQGSQTVRISANTGSADYAVATVDDDADEPNWTVWLRATSGTGYYLGSRISARRVVNDNDATSIALAGSAEELDEGSSKTFTLSIGRGLYSGERLSIPLSFAGTADRGASGDYTLACDSATGVACSGLNDGAATATVTVTELAVRPESEPAWPAAA